MKQIVLLILVASTAVIAQEVFLTKYENDYAGPNAYRFIYELSDGTGREEQGELKNVGTDAEALSVKGSYHWKGARNNYVVTYVADENGYRPKVILSPRTSDAAFPSAVVASLLGK